MHSPSSRLVSLLTACALGALASPSPAGISRAQRCTALELDATARAVVAHVACQARALRQGTPVRPGCPADVAARLAAAFARIEARGGCPFVGVLPEVDAAIDELVDALATNAPSGPPFGRCAAAKLRAASRKTFGDLACDRVAVRRGAEPDPACRQAVLARLQRALAMAERRFSCETPGDTDAILTLVEAFVTATAAHLIEGPGAVDPRPKNLAAAIDGGAVELTWTAPAPASMMTHVRVLRRLNVPPTNPADGAATEVFFGTATAATHALTALLPTTSATPRTYHYAAFGCTAGGDCESAGSRTTLAPTLVQALRGGGYVLHWRHAAATVCADQTGLGTAATTTAPDWWRSCDAQCGTATARQMDQTGVTQATTIGRNFDRLGIPVGRVLSSEFCRNFTTATLMNLGPATELRQDITFFVYDEANRCNASYALIDEAPAAGTNTAIVGHAGFVCPVLAELAWGEAAIFKPDGTGGNVLVARVLSDAWDGL